MLTPDRKETTVIKLTLFQASVMSQRELLVFIHVPTRVKKKRTRIEQKKDTVQIQIKECL
jgi:hypothetical protein